MPNSFLKWLYHFAFPPAMNESSSCSASLTPLGTVCFAFFLSHSNRNVMIFIFLVCISLKISDVEYFSMYLLDIHIFFFCEVSVQTFYPVFFFFLAAPCSLQDLSSPTRDWIQATAVKAPHPNHWTDREVTFYPVFLLGHLRFIQL